MIRLAKMNMRKIVKEANMTRPIVGLACAREHTRACRRGMCMPLAAAACRSIGGTWHVRVSLERRCMLR